MTDATTNDQAEDMVSHPTGEFAIQKIYIKDISFETPNSPDIFKLEWDPKVSMQLSSEGMNISDELTEVVLTVTVTTMIGEKAAYLVEIHVAGIFHIKGFPKEVIEHMAATVCPNILFPFAREHVCDLVTRGGFPQLLLAPVNFEALYAQQQQELEKTGTTGSENDQETTDVKH